MYRHGENKGLRKLFYSPCLF